MEKEIDVREVFLALWKKKNWIASGAALGMILSAIYGFFIASPLYESSILLLPTQNQGADQLGAAASLLGKKANLNLDVELYQSLLTSRTVIHKTLFSTIDDYSDTTKCDKRRLFEVFGLDTSNRIALDGAVRALTQSVFVDPRETGESGIIEVRVQANSPWLAKEIANTLIEVGQEEIYNVRIKKSNMILERLKKAAGNARLEWDTAARIYAKYLDRNRSIQLADQHFELNRLAVDKSAKEQKYLLARKELEGLELDREKAAPPLMVLDSANYPSFRSKPKRSLLLLLGIFSGAFLSTAFVLGQRTLFSEQLAEEKD